MQCSDARAINCTVPAALQGNTILHAVWNVGKSLHIKFSLHVLGTQHVMNTADEN